MRGVVDGVLKYAKNRTSPEERQQVRLNDLIAEVLRSLQIMIESNSAQILVGPLPEIEADPSLLSQLFQNLIENAIKFRGTASPRIRISVVPEDDYWQFRIQDNGIGIDAHHREKIFAPFARLHSDQEYPGTGIGLTLCRDLLDKSGGSIWVEANPAGGSIFCFKLPKDLANDAPIPVSGAALSYTSSV